VVRVELSALGGSALTAAIDVPKNRGLDQMLAGIPITYVPARNTVFLALALGFAEVVGASDLFIGVNAVDYSGYPDCRPEFIASFEQLANLATKAGVEGKLRFRIHTPLVELTKAEIIRRGLALGVDYGLTHSCYDPDLEGRACGQCDSCLLRLKGFAEAGLPDPARYQS
jgi:7-cyano-7-deazaguanine synthase